MKFKVVAILGAFAAIQARALTINEPLEFETKVAVPIVNFTCTPGPFMMQRLTVKLSTPVGRAEQTGVLMSAFDNSAECAKTIADMKGQALNGEVTLTAKVSQQTVLKLASNGRNACEGAQQEIISIGVNGLQVSESFIAVERDLDCPAGIDAQRVQTKDGVLLVLHNNGVPTAPKQ